MKKLFIVAFAVLFSGIVGAQKTADLKGAVYDERGGAASYVLVILDSTHSVYADDAGLFNFSKVPVGEYTIQVQSMEFEPFSKKIQVVEGRNEFQAIHLKKLATSLGQVDVITKVEPFNSKHETAVSVFKMDNVFINRVPTMGGQPELMQVLTILPGVTSSGDQGGQLYIRGGPPVQNKVLMDGAIINNPFHSIGLFSVFDADLIKSADIYTGGFGAQYGGRISSIMDISIREGNKKRFSGKLGISPFTARGIIEGPFKKMSEDGGPSASFLISARGSYLEQSSRTFYPYADSSGLPFNFWDLYGKISVNTGSQGSRLSLFAFSHNDNVNYNDITRLNWRTIGGGANFLVLPGAANVRIDGVLAYSNYQIKMVESNEQLLERFSVVNNFNFGLNFHQFLGNHRITYGMETIVTSTDLRYDNPYAVRIENQENTTELAAFVRGKFNRWKFVFDPSIRLHYYASLGEASLEPRLSIKYNATSWFRLKLAAGMYSQNLVAANSDRDVVNLFYGFLTGEEDIVSTFQGNPVRSKLSKSQHAIFGLEFDIAKYIAFNVEGYYMNFGQLTNVNRNLTLQPNDPGPDYLKKEIIIEKGYAAGMDATVKLEYKNLYLWLVYSFMKTERTDELITYAPHFDRRHNINIVAHYAFGKNKQFEASARWNIGSGFPFTQTQGFYELLNFQDGISTDYTTTNGNLGIVYAEVNKGRLPWFHRLDINFKYTLFFKNKNKEPNGMKIDFNAGATNVYNRQNIFYIDRVTNKRINQLPLLYNVGMNFEF